MGARGISLCTEPRWSTRLQRFCAGQPRAEERFDDGPMTHTLDDGCQDIVAAQCRWPSRGRRVGVRPMLVWARATPTHHPTHTSPPYLQGAGG